MKSVFWALIMTMMSAISWAEDANSVQLKGRVLGSFVSTSDGLIKGHILNVTDPDSVKLIVELAKHDPTKVLLVHNNPALLSKFAGKEVTLIGQLEVNHNPVFHTHFLFDVQNVMAD